MIFHGRYIGRTFVPYQLNYLNMKKKFLLTNALLLCLGLVSAQQQNQKIVFPNPLTIDNSDGRFVRPTSDGGYILTGIVTGSQTNGSIRLIKLNSEQEVEWDKV